MIYLGYKDKTVVFTCCMGFVQLGHTYFWDLEKSPYNLLLLLFLLLLLLRILLLLLFIFFFCIPRHALMPVWTRHAKSRHPGIQDPFFYLSSRFVPWLDFFWYDKYNLGLREIWSLQDPLVPVVFVLDWLSLPTIHGFKLASVSSFFCSLNCNN